MKTFIMLLLILVSNAAFAARTPIEMQCRNPRHEPGLPPGRVACILDNNCATCHGEVHRDFGDLDLSRWLNSKSNPAVYTFPHLNDAREQRARRETFERLLRRITTADHKYIMPPGGAMKEAEVQELVAWIQAVLKEDAALTRRRGPSK